MKRRFITYICFAVVALFAILVAIPLALFYSLAWPRDERRHLQFHEWFCTCCRIAARHIPGVQTEWLNPHAEDFSKPAVLIANHQSYLDLLVLIALHPKMVVMTTRWVWRFPLFHSVIQYLEYYPAARGLESGEEHMASLLQRGYSILIFPEGTRSANCRILKFKRGAFYLAQQLHADIVPLYLHGCGAVLPKLDRTLRPGRITVEIGERVPADDASTGETYGEQTRYWHKHYINKFDAPAQ